MLGGLPQPLDGLCIVFLDTQPVYGAIGKPVHRIEMPFFGGGLEPSYGYPILTCPIEKEPDLIHAIGLACLCPQDGFDEVVSQFRWDVLG